MLLKNKVALLTGGDGATNIVLAQMLLKAGAVVIVPAKSAGELTWVREFETARKSGTLITFLADYPDFYKASEIIADITERFGNIDISIICFASPVQVSHLINLNITEWERMVERNVTGFFVALRLAYEAFKQRKEGMLITVDTTPFIRDTAGAKLAYLSRYMQQKLAEMFLEEATGTGLAYHHLYIDRTGNRDVTPPADNFVKPDALGRVILGLYNNMVTRNKPR